MCAAESSVAPAATPSQKPASTPPTAATLTQELSSLLKDHWKLFVWVVALAVALNLGNAWNNRIAASDSAKAVLAKQAADTQAQQVEALKEAAQAQSQQTQTLISQVLQDRQALEAGISARITATTKQQTADQSLPPSDLSTRWQGLLSLPVGSVQPSPSGFAVTDQAARSTVEDMENVPTLEKNLADEKSVAADQQNAMQSQQQLVTSLQQEVSGLNAKVVDNGKACDAQIKAVQASGRNGKRNWFLRGLAIGAGVAAYLLK